MSFWSTLNNDLQTLTNNLMQTGQDATAKKKQKGSTFRANNVVGYVVGSQTYVTFGGGANFCVGARNSVVTGVETSANISPYIPSATMSLAEQKWTESFYELKPGKQKVAAGEEKAILKKMEVCANEMQSVYNKFRGIVKNNETELSRLNALDDSIQAVNTRASSVALEARQLTTHIDDTANCQNTVTSHMEQLNTQVESAINTIDDIESELSTAITNIASSSVHMFN
ncbi:hypothetical protein [uncultured Shewanella sp.]|uniref:hypothetical protein n=1 Tax=uncultured Shewanella sp. TaxID=173975 RepID=UPI002628E9B9|nr:hypothetical protein [uncultured Shewanella sp.]